MIQSDKVLYEDIKSLNDADFIDWGMLKDTNILITGATGLLGSSLIYSIDYVNQVRKLNISIYALVRNLDKAQAVFSSIISHDTLHLIIGDMENLPIITNKIDYIVHAASQTASKEFVQHPVETICTSTIGTLNLLKMAKDKSIRGCVYLSSMEVYGYPKRGHKVKEDEIGSLSPLDLRNSYPIGKIVSESISCAYAQEYDIPVKICRLTQTFGPGVHYNDNRIFAYFGRCIKEKTNIVLKTKGETERCYLYTADAVAAILLIMLKGEPGKAYNVANEETYCSIHEMAERIAKLGNIAVEYDIQDNKLNGYPDTLYMDLDTTFLKQLGWRSLKNYTIEEMFQRMIRDFR